MPDTLDPSATPVADPKVSDEAGSQSSDPTSATVVGESRSMPDAAYKGLQRQLDRQQRENASLRSRIEELQARPSTPQNEAAIVELLQALQAKDPAAAQAMALSIRQKLLADENQTLRSQVAQRQQADELAKVEQSNLNALRDIAADLGANPDSPMIDYGDSTMYLHERMARVRETAREAAKPATPTPPVNRTPAQTHNTQPGVPPTPRKVEGRITNEEYQAALADYRARPTAAKAAKVDEMREKFMAQQLADLG